MSSPIEKPTASDTVDTLAMRGAFFVFIVTAALNTHLEKFPRFATGKLDYSIEHFTPPVLNRWIQGL
jgi:hypothetical protein